MRKEKGAGICRVLSAVFLAGLTVFSGRLQAQKRLGDYLEAAAVVLPNRFTRSASQNFTYTDNVNSAPSRDARHSLSSETSLSCSLLRNLKSGLTYGFDGEVSYEWYDDREINEDTGIRWSVVPVLRGDVNLLGNDAISFTLHSESNFDEFDRSNTTKVRSQTTGAQLTYENRGNRRVGFIASASYDYEHYFDSEFDDRNNSEYTVTLSPYYQLTAKMKTGIEFSYGQTLYKSNTSQDDSTYMGINAFLDFRPSEKIGLYVYGGAERRAYSGEAEDTDSSNVWKPDGGIRVSYTRERFSINFQSDIGQEDTRSAGRGGRTTWGNQFGVNWKLTDKLTLHQSIGYDVTDEKNGDTSDSGEWTYSLGTDYRFNERISVSLNYSYSHCDYRYDAKSNYEVNEISTGLSWSF